MEFIFKFIFNLQKKVIRKKIVFELIELVPSGEKFFSPLFLNEIKLLSGSVIDLITVIENKFPNKRDYKQISFSTLFSLSSW